MSADTQNPMNSCCYATAAVAAMQMLPDRSTQKCRKKSTQNACLTTVYTSHRLRLFLSRDLLRDLLLCLVLSLLLLLLRFFLLSSLSCLLLLDLLTRCSGDLDLLLPALSLLLPLLLLFTSLSFCLTDRLRLLLSFLDD